MVTGTNQKKSSPGNYKVSSSRKSSSQPSLKTSSNSWTVSHGIPRCAFLTKEATCYMDLQGQVKVHWHKLLQLKSNIRSALLTVLIESTISTSISYSILLPNSPLSWFRMLTLSLVRGRMPRKIIR